MVRIKLKIEKVEDKLSKIGRKFMSIITSEGVMSCFEDPVKRDLQECVGKEAEIEVQERGNFKNITRVYKPEQAEKLQVGLVDELLIINKKLDMIISRLAVKG